jgi:biopolymer transport protein ExbD
MGRAPGLLYDRFPASGVWLAIPVDAEGKIQLNNTPVTLDELETKLTAMKASTPDIPVVVRGDTAVQYKGVMSVLDVLGRLGIDKIGLATQKPK